MYKHSNMTSRFIEVPNQSCQLIVWCVAIKFYQIRNGQHSYVSSQSCYIRLWWYGWVFNAQTYKHADLNFLGLSNVTSCLANPDANPFEVREGLLRRSPLGKGLSDTCSYQLAKSLPVLTSEFACLLDCHAIPMCILGCTSGAGICRPPHITQLSIVLLI